MYRVNEGTFDLPATWLDRSVNILASDMTAFGISLTITRDNIPWGVSFAEYMNDQAEKAASGLTDFELIGRQDLFVDGMSAHEIEATWSRKGTPVHLLSTTLHLGPKAMIISSSVDNYMSEGQKAEMRRIIGTFRFARERATA